MEVINDVGKSLAQAIELIKQYLAENDIDRQVMLESAQIVLEKALEKLTHKM